MHRRPHRSVNAIRQSVEQVGCLQTYIQSKRDQLLAEREAAPQLFEDATRLREECKQLVCRYQKRMQKCLLRKAASMEEEAKVRMSMTREYELEKKCRKYMVVLQSMPKKNGGAYGRESTDPTAHKFAASQLIEEFKLDVMKKCDKVTVINENVCASCNTDLLIQPSTSTMCCPKCGSTVSYFDSTSGGLSYDDNIDYAPYSYKRINHFLMWLNMCQGCETYQVPLDTIKEVVVDLKTRLKVKHKSNVTSRMVHESLRHLKLRKSYDHVIQVTSRITGVYPPRLSDSVIDKLKMMFLQMQPAFQKHAPRSRTNFLSYSYVVYRCFQILGLDHMLQYVMLLKGRDKLEANDAIFKKMCYDLKWPTFDLPSTTH
jgi:predicted RNA-binding Zn-ribbon protein involved in translation (DUF1610 family)